MLADHRSAPIDEKLRATLTLLEKMTLQPAELTPDDVLLALTHGASREALAEAMEVAYLFNIYDRLADTLGWDVPATASGAYQASAGRLLSRGYR